MTSGAMREKLNFQVRANIQDPYGNPQAGDFQTVYTCAAELIPLKGSEPVIASRLSGVQPFIIRIRSCVAARAITTAWRAVDARNPSRIFNLRSVANFDQKSDWLDFMADNGVAT